MSIESLVKKLRKAANILEDLLVEEGPAEEKKAARGIRKYAAKQRKKKKHPGATGFKYNGTHWKQKAAKQ